MNTQQNTQNPTPAMGSLYVGDLHPDVSEAQLYDKFSPCGPLLSVRVCRDMVTRKSLGYAYVNYQNPTDAEAALENYNFDEVKGRPIRIMWSQRDPSLRKSGVGNIFIKNLSKDIEQKELYDTFLAFGHILSCKIATDENGKSKGYGFVHYETEDGANNAIDAVNDMIISDKKVYVGKFIPKSERNSGDTVQKFTNCFVKNFGDELDTPKLEELFGKYGTITSAKVMVDSNGKSKGFGFVCFKEPGSAEAAVKELDGHKIGEKSIYVARAQKKQERVEELRVRFEKQKIERTSRYAQGVNLYVKNLDDTMTDEKLKEEFKVFGNITSAKVMTDSSGRSKGFGFVCFSCPGEAAKAVSDMNGKIVGSKFLYVALAQRKDDRKTHLAHQYLQRMSQYRNAGINQAVPAGAMNPLLSAQAVAAQAAVGAQPASAAAAAAAGLGAMHPYYVQQQLQNSRFFAPSFIQQQAQAGRNPLMAAAVAQGRAAPNTAAAAWPAAQLNAAQQQANLAALHHTRQMAAPGNMQMAQFDNAQMRNFYQQQQAQQQGQALTQNSAAFFSQRPFMMPQQQQQMQQQRPGMPATANAQSVAQQVPNGVPTQRPSMASVVGANPGAVRQNATGQTGRSSPGHTFFSALSGSAPNEQKQMIGERLYPKVEQMQPQLAGKITGMLLEMENSELLHMMDTPEALRVKVEEAVSVLQNHKPAQPASKPLPNDGVVESGASVQGDITENSSTNAATGH